MAKNDRKRAPRKQVQFLFPGAVENTRLFARLGRRVVEELIPGHEQFAYEVELCLVEALSNVFFHAHQKMEQKIKFRLEWDTRQLIMKVFDRGPGFSLEDVLRRADEDLFLEHGRGVKIIAAFVDELQYVQGKRQNILRLVKSLPQRIPEALDERVESAK